MEQQTVTFETQGRVRGEATVLVGCGASVKRDPLNM